MDKAAEEEKVEYEKEDDSLLRGFKMCFAGKEGVGKTSIIEMLAHGRIQADQTPE